MSIEITADTKWEVVERGEVRSVDEGDGTVAVWLIGFTFRVGDYTATVCGDVDNGDPPSAVIPQGGKLYGYTLAELNHL